MARWVKLCTVGEVPQPGNVVELETDGVAICLANANGELSALDNVCPHRGGPLGQGWMEGEMVVCPWHSWTFHAKTGAADYPPNEWVRVFPVRVEDGEVLIEIEEAAPQLVHVKEI